MDVRSYISCLTKYTQPTHYPETTEEEYRGGGKFGDFRQFSKRKNENSFALSNIEIISPAPVPSAPLRKIYVERWKKVIFQNILVEKKQKRARFCHPLPRGAYPCLPARGKKVGKCKGSKNWILGVEANERGKEKYTTDSRPQPIQVCGRKYAEKIHLCKQVADKQPFFPRSAQSENFPLSLRAFLSTSDEKKEWEKERRKGKKGLKDKLRLFVDDLSPSLPSLSPKPPRQQNTSWKKGEEERKGSVEATNHCPLLPRLTSRDLVERGTGNQYV